MTRTSPRSVERAPHIGADLTSHDFKSLFRGHPGGVAVITADPGTGPVALTATSVASVSVEPPLLVFSLSSISSASAAISASDTIVVHLLDEHDLELAKRGATSGVDRFADTSTWARLSTGEPVFPGVRAWVRCAIINRMDAGGSTVIAAHALQHHLARDIDPGEAGGGLVYHNRTWHRLGKQSVLV
ncbi:MAG TPA: flavin reductase family protein [Microbacterium sp.]|nr:flavin reductase family protein [Microbacterium sp.]